MPELRPDHGPANSPLTFGRSGLAASKTFPRFPSGPSLPKSKVYPDVTQTQQTARTTMEIPKRNRFRSSRTIVRVSLTGPFKMSSGRRALWGPMGVG